MDQALIDLLRSLGGQWLTLAVVGCWALYKTGAVQRLAGVGISERAQLSRDQQQFVAGLEKTIQRLEERMTLERQECEARLDRQREDCDRELAALREQIATLIHGEARWRHLVSNLAQYVAALQAALRKAGIEVPRFGGWDRFIANGGDPLMQLGDADD